MKKLLIVSYTSSVKDPRVFKEWTFLKDDFEITIAGLAPCVPDVPFIEIRKSPPRPLEKVRFALGMLSGSAKSFLDSYRIDPVEAKKQKFDLVLCNDLFPLPLAFELAQGAPVFFDAHEYYSEQHNESLFWRIVFKPVLRKLEKTYIPRVAGMSSVSPAIAERYEREFGKEVILVRNIPIRQADLPPVPVNRPIQLIRHGDAHPSRKLELLIRMMELLGEDYMLNLVLIGHPKYQKKLKRMARNVPNVRFLPPAPLQEVAKAVNGYDIGICLLPPINYNHAKVLPNKLFEYMQASLAVAIGPSSEMGGIVRKYGNGIISSDFTPESLADAIRKYTPDDIQKMKSASRRASQEMTAEADYQRMKQQLFRIVGR